MKITPLDIQKHEFSVVRKGYDAEEVRNFLQLVSEELEQALKDNMALRDEFNVLTEECDEHKGREKILKNTLLTAQKMSQDVKENATKEASLIIKEAELRADRIVSQAQVRATKIESSITELKIQRNQMRLKIKAGVDQLHELLRMQEAEDEQDEKILFMRRTEESLEKMPPNRTKKQ
ncbi:DivIVA domain-containing protein [Acidobacteriota bacterium]